jgi:S1-C subfamily serine protease
VWSVFFDQFDGGKPGPPPGAVAAGGLPPAPGGLRVPELVAWGTPAFEAGLDEGDVLTHADGEPVASVEDWQAAVRAHKPGDRMRIQFTRRGAPFQRAITLVEDPTLEVVSLESTGGTLSSDQQAFRDAWLGARKK